MLIIVSSPSGGGKTTICKMLTNRSDSPVFSNVAFSISATTRSIRPGETDGVDYHFFTKKKFQDYIEKDMFLEYAEIHGNLYGTLMESIHSDKHTLYDIDYQGFLQMKEKKVNMISVFLLPPSIDNLKERLHARGDISHDAINMRMENAKNEISHAHLYDFVFTNNTIEETYKAVSNFIRSKITL